MLAQHFHSLKGGEGRSTAAALPLYVSPSRPPRLSHAPPPPHAKMLPCCGYSLMLRDPGPLQVASLGAENEQLLWELKSTKQKQQQAEQRLQQQEHSDRLVPTSTESKAQTNRLRDQLDTLSRQNSELNTELSAAQQSLKAEQALSAQNQKEHQQHRESTERASWELQHQVDNLNQENQSLIAHHEKLETRFESLTKQLAKAQHAQHAGAQSKSDLAQNLARASALQEQVNNLMESSALQVEQRHRLENEATTLQRRLANAESALSQHQQRVRGHQEAESASNGKIAVLQQQAERVVGDNEALQAQCRQQTVDMKRLQNDVQVSRNAHCILAEMSIFCSTSSLGLVHMCIQYAHDRTPT